MRGEPYKQGINSRTLAGYGSRTQAITHVDFGVHVGNTIPLGIEMKRRRRCDGVCRDCGFGTAMSTARDMEAVYQAVQSCRQTARKRRRRGSFQVPVSQTAGQRPAQVSAVQLNVVGGGVGAFICLSE